MPPRDQTKEILRQAAALSSDEERNKFIEKAFERPLQRVRNEIAEEGYRLSIDGTDLPGQP